MCARFFGEEMELTASGVQYCDLPCPHPIRSIIDREFYLAGMDDQELEILLDPRSQRCADRKGDVAKIKSLVIRENVHTGYNFAHPRHVQKLLKTIVLLKSIRKISCAASPPF